MLRVSTLVVVLYAITMNLATAQISARMFQYPDVSADRIVFSYGDDLWIANKTGGTASKLSSPPGTETYPKFSPDGTDIAFSGNYAGNDEIYVIPAKGGIPKRITHHGSFERVLGWTPDGENCLFASPRNSERQRYSQIYTISKTGGQAMKLAIPYGEIGSLSPDGIWLAYTPKSRSGRTWKRYRGGMAPDIWLFNLKTEEAKKVAESEANDEYPMWHGKTLYFLSDRGKYQRNNIYKYNLDTEAVTQVTYFENFDVHYPSIGPNDLIFEAAGKLHLLSLPDEKLTEVTVDVVSDQMSLVEKDVDASKHLTTAAIAPDGKRVVAEARGELFSVPAKDGYVKNLSRTSGVAERFPAWSPDGKLIAYWSDQSGEYELTLKDLTKNGHETKITDLGPGYRYHLYWSPDSKKLAFIDQTMQISYVDIESKKVIPIDRALSLFHGGLSGFEVDWSPDSKWILYHRDLEHSSNAIFAYNIPNQKLHQVTSGYYSDSNPRFDPEGKYIYFLTNRTFRPVYSDMDNTWVYPNSTNVAIASLTQEIPSPLAPKNDDVKIKEDEEADQEDEDDEKQDDEKKESEKESSEKSKDIEFEVEGFERRIVLLEDVEAGNYGGLDAVKGKVIYHQAPRSGSSDKDRPLKYYDLEKRESKTILDNVSSFEISANGEKILAYQQGKMAVVDVAEEQKMETIALSDMSLKVVPREEWKQIFNDVWRFQRDFFYDKNMHGVDWLAMKSQYGALIDHAITRSDVNYVIGELIGEMNASHTYRGGGDQEKEKQRNTGYLGIDWNVKNNLYTIKKIVRGAEWDAEMRSPLDMPGIKVKEGDYILAVNGEPLHIDVEPYAAFDGLAGKTVELTVSSHPTWDSARTIFVELMDSENRLRHLAWIENNRQTVEAATGGRVGYIYVRSTGVDGQNELVRQFMGQWKKEALIIDERFNSGGQIPDRFIELLNRKPLAYWDVRDGQTWQWPPVANFGAKVMLINGWSGSGGDAFPDYFKKAGLGKLIGKRTWGGLIGITGAPSLIDGGFISVPTFRMYNPDGSWFKEGYGVDPDIEVEDDPALMAKGIDPQLQKAIEVILEEMANVKPAPKSPKKEKRT